MSSKMFSDHERFRNLAAGIQSITIAMGVVVGGIWAVYAFQEQRVSEIAKLEAGLKVEALKKESDITAEITIDAIEKVRSEHVVFGTLRITNRGTKAVDVPLKDTVEIGYVSPPFKNAKEYEQLGFVRIYCGVGKSMRSQTVPAKSTELFPFSIPLDKQGLYIVSYVAKPALDEVLKTANATAAKDDTGADAWHAVKFFVIQ